jgi:rhodanese-related sulfurtransferase
MSRALSAAVLAAVALGASPVRGAEPFRIATVEEVERMLSAPDVVVYDANTEEIFAKNHLPGARFVRRDFGPRDLPADREARLVFYCSNPR